MPSPFPGMNPYFERAASSPRSTSGSSGRSGRSEPLSCFPPGGMPSRSVASRLAAAGTGTSSDRSRVRDARTCSRRASMPPVRYEKTRRKFLAFWHVVPIMILLL